MAHRRLFPFAAIVGQEQVKEALLITLVNPKAGGVLITGEQGTGKSTLVRSLAEILPDRDIVNLPLNATEDRVFGSLDIEHAVLKGERRFSPGIVAKAHRNVLYIDEFNLLRREIMNAVLDIAAAGVNVVEREGISYRHNASYTIIGTLNPEEGTLPPTVLDRVGLYAAVNREQNVAARAEIVRRILSYERQPGLFVQSYQAETDAVRCQVQQARDLVGSIAVTEDMMHLAAGLCAKAHCAGHRAEIFLLEAAKGIAALAGRVDLLPADLQKAGYYVLPHRRRQEQQTPQDDPIEQQEAEQDESPQPPAEPQANDTPQPQGSGENTAQPQPDPVDTDPENADHGQGVAPDRTDFGSPFPLGQMQITLPQDREVRRGSGKRSLTRTDTRQGRYVQACLPGGPVTDVAFDATLRAAAPYQRSRAKGACCLTIQQQDLRQKVREKRIGNTFLFIVDASGSMGAKQRMRAVKGAVFALLQDAYQKRDQVSLIAFRRQTAEILLPVTRSVELAQKCLQHMPTGGKTPLAEGLYTALTMLQSMQHKDREMQPVIVLITDGRANSGASGSDAITAALQAARKIGQAGILSVVIDTEMEFVKLAMAQNVAHAMGAAYFHLQELSEANIIQIVRNVQQ